MGLVDDRAASGSPQLSALFRVDRPAVRAAVTAVSTLRGTLVRVTQSLGQRRTIRVETRVLVLDVLAPALAAGEHAVPGQLAARSTVRLGGQPAVVASDMRIAPLAERHRQQIDETLAYHEQTHTLLLSALRQFSRGVDSP